MQWKNLLIKCLFGAFMFVALVACSGSPSSRSTETYVDDATITTKVKTALIGNEETAARNIQVDTYKGVVQLSGFVQNENQRNQAGEIASGVEGVIRVQNDLLIR